MSRIETREAVVFFVYQHEFRIESLEEQLAKYLEINSQIEDDKDYFLGTARGVILNREAIDESISKYLKKWTINRIPKLDKAILETAIYEISHSEDIPTSVAINEAVRLSKKSGTEDSSSYINGVLSSYEKSL